MANRIAHTKVIHKLSFYKNARSHSAWVNERVQLARELLDCIAYYRSVFVSTTFVVGIIEGGKYITTTIVER